MTGNGTVSGSLSRRISGNPTARRSFPISISTPLIEAPGVEIAYLEPADSLRAEQLADVDALILLTAALHRRQHPPQWPARRRRPLRRRL